jgi:hypothetical protein
LLVSSCAHCCYCPQCPTAVNRILARHVGQNLTILIRKCLCCRIQSSKLCFAELVHCCKLHRASIVALTEAAPTPDQREHPICKAHRPSQRTCGSGRMRQMESGWSAPCNEIGRLHNRLGRQWNETLGEICTASDICGYVCRQGCWDLDGRRGDQNTQSAWARMQNVCCHCHNAFTRSFSWCAMLEHGW